MSKQQSRETNIRLPQLQSDAYVCFAYANSLHLLQCYSALPEKDQRIHSLDSQKGTWTTAAVSSFKSKHGVYFPKPGLAKVVIANTLYCFGGQDSKGKSDFRLAALDLERMVYKNQMEFSIGQVWPEPRINPCLTAYQGSYLILFETCASADSNASAHCWIFDICLGYWYRVSRPFPYHIQIKSMCTDSNKVYIFGRKQDKDHNQLFQFRLQNTLHKNRYSLQVAGFQQVVMPQKRQNYPAEGASIVMAEHKSNRTAFVFQSYNQNALDKMSPVAKMWVLDSILLTWLPTDIQANVDYIDVVYLEESNSVCFVPRNRKKQAILQLTIPIIELTQAVRKERFKDWKTCEICYETLINNNTLMEPAFKISKQMMDSMTEKINFPFAALGIFADLALTHSATEINYHYTYYQGSPMLKIEDDSRTNYSNDQLEEVIVNFTAEVNCNFGSVEKRTRGVLVKDFAKREYGSNLKIASLRLGSQMLFISLTSNYDARVAYFTMENDEYVCYFYAFDEKTNTILDDYSVEAKAYVERRHGDLIKSALHSNLLSIKYASYKNTTYILKLRTVINEQGKQVPEIQPYVGNDGKDILYISPNPTIYKSYLDFGCRINESIDTSLIAYLSALFIKNEHLKMTVQVKDSQRKVARKEDILQHVDRAALIKVISSIDSLLVNYDLKSIDLIVNSRLNKKIGIFHNGVLIYHKSRLVKRYGCELGTLLNCLEFAGKVSYGYFNIFGSIEVPDSLQANQQKTDFINQLMLEKLYSRLLLVHQSLLKNIDNDKEDAKQPASKEGPKLRSRAIEQNEPARHVPVKKVKRSHEDDESYHGN